MICPTTTPRRRRVVTAVAAVLVTVATVLAPSGAAADTSPAWVDAWNEMRAAAELGPVTYVGDDAPESEAAAAWARYVVDNDKMTPDPGWTGDGAVAGADALVVAGFSAIRPELAVRTLATSPVQVELMLHPGLDQVAFGSHSTDSAPTGAGDHTAAAVFYVSFDLGERGDDIVTFPAADRPFDAVDSSWEAAHHLMVGFPTYDLDAPTFDVDADGATVPVADSTVGGFGSWALARLDAPLPRDATITVTVRDGDDVVAEWSFTTPPPTLGAQFPEWGPGGGGGTSRIIDVAPGRYYTDAVTWALIGGITTGVGGGEMFQPDRAVTRGEVVTFLWRWWSRPSTPPSGRFDDIAGAYFTEPIDWAAATGLTTGVGGSRRYEPHRAVTRGEVVTLLWRAAGSPDVADGSGFADVRPGDFYAEAVSWAAATGLTTGVGGTNRFEPHRAVTRGELVTFMWRLRGTPLAN